MDFKYKIADVAKEFDLPAKKVIETVSPLTGEAYKTGGTFGEKELNVLLETLTRANAETSMDAYLNSAKAQPEPKPEPKPETKPAATPAAKPSANGTASAGSTPQTGDATDFTMVASVAGIGVVIAGAAYAMKRRNN